MSKLTENEIHAMVSKRFGAALSDHEDLSKQRERALDFYYGRPLGNEIDGRSQVVTKDMMDTIEWMMPSLMRVFMTRNAVQFDPVGPEDEELAKQETEYVSHVLWKQNPGFMVLYSWIKDALMQKVGYVQYRWEEEEKVCYEEYTGLTQDQLTFTLNDLESYGEVEVVGSEASHTAPGLPQTWDIKVKIRSKRGKLVVEPNPPDEIIVSSDCRGDIKQAKFAGRLRKLTRSDLMKQGFSRREVEEITDFSASDTGVQTARDGQRQAEERDEGVDWATTEVTVLDCYTEIDEDDDGFSELRHFILGGKSILVDEEVDEIQFESWTPVPMPHKHAGLDVYDMVEDLQRIHTGLTRGLLDNAYFGNNQRLAYDKNRVNLNMLQVNRPGGHVAVDGDTTGAVTQLPVADIASRLLPVIQHFDQTRTRRTGVGDATTGVDADVLAQSTKGAYMNAVTLASQRIEAIARIFAETGLSSLYKSMHKMLMKHQDWPDRFRIKNDWVQVNPTEWKERSNLTVSVGLGTSGKEEVRNNLMAMGQVLQQAAQVPGLVQPKNVYAYVKRMQVELGLESESFITDPASEEYQQWAQSQNQAPPEDPYVSGKKIDAQVRIQEKQIDAVQKTLDRNQARDLKITELEVNSGVDLARAGIGAEVAIARGNRPPGPEGEGAAVQ